MRAVEEPPMETIHLYVVREKEKQPFTFLPLFGAFLCLLSLVALTLYSGEHLLYEHETIRVPAHFFFQNFGISEVVIPTGVKTYGATTAHGELTIYNGSIITQIVPAGMIVTSSSGVEVVVEDAVEVPAGNPPNYGIATVSAYVKIQGKYGNIQKNTINEVLGSSLYIRNTSPFTGGTDSYSIRVVSPQDRQIALVNARVSLATQKAHTQAILAKPCNELVAGVVKVVVKWTCQFVSYPNLQKMQITSVRLVGKNLLVDVVFVARPNGVWRR